MVVVLYDTNTAPTSYVVEVTNMAHKPCVFTAWTECATNGAWSLVAPRKQRSILKPSEKNVFDLPKPEHGKARIGVQYRRLQTSQWDHWLTSIKALIEIYPKWEQVYIDAQ